MYQSEQNQGAQTPVDRHHKGDGEIRKGDAQDRFDRLDKVMSTILQRLDRNDERLERIDRDRRNHNDNVSIIDQFETRSVDFPIVPPGERHSRPKETNPFKRNYDHDDRYFESDFEKDRQGFQSDFGYRPSNPHLAEYTPLLGNQRRSNTHMSDFESDDRYFRPNSRDAFRPDSRYRYSNQHPIEYTPGANEQTRPTPQMPDYQAGDRQCYPGGRDMSFRSRSYRSDEDFNVRVKNFNSNDDHVCKV